MRTNVPLLAVLVGGLGLQLCAPALADQITPTSSPGVAIPDNDLNGLAETIDLKTSISYIGGVILTLDIFSGGTGITMPTCGTPIPAGPASRCS